MPTLTADYSFLFKDNGVLLNRDDITTPFMDVTKVAGLDMPPFRTNERTREGMDGGSLDIDFSDMRTIVIDGVVYGSPSDLHVYLDALKANYAPSNVSYPFYFYSPGLGQRVIYCKSLGVKYDYDQAMRNGQSPVQIQLKAEDPTVYVNETVTYSCGLSSVATTGYGFPLGFPFGFGGAAAVDNGFNARNEGNKPVGAIISFYNVTSPAVYSDTTGQFLQLNTTVSPGEFYELDLKNRTVRLNGESNRRNLLANSSRWFLLQPGDNMLRFIGSTASGTPVMTIAYRSGSY
jgi:hypothetical protein